VAATCAPTPGGGGGPTTTTTAPKGCATPGTARTVAYRSIPGVPADAVSVDVWAPATACRAPVVMWVHGGGYHTGDKANQIAAKRSLFNGRGWILVSVNYRLTVAGDPSSAHFPDHYDDVASAVAWVRSNIARYGGDPGRLALLGHSAGADIVANVAGNPTYLAAKGLGLGVLDCAGPLDTEGFDKVTSVGDGESAQWESALGNEPGYLTKTSATRFVKGGTGVPATIGVYRGTAQRQQIEKAYLEKVASLGVRTATIDARTLSHGEVNSRIGAAGDTVMTPPLVSFLTTCFR
jgi:arylformamidase